MNETFYIALLFLVVGVVFAGLGFPLMRRRIPPNIWYGFRTRKTLSNEELWYSINQVTGKDMIWIGAIIAAASLIVMALRERISTETTVIVMVAVCLISTAYMAIHGIAILRRM